MQIRTILKATAIPAIIAGGLLATSAGSAAHAATLTPNVNSTQVTFTTHDTHVADTTWGSASGSNNEQTQYGPVWAYDNLERVAKVTQLADGTYSVAINAHGNYTAFADPRDGDQVLTTWCAISAGACWPGGLAGGYRSAARSETRQATAR